MGSGPPGVLPALPGQAQSPSAPGFSRRGFRRPGRCAPGGQVSRRGPGQAGLCRVLAQVQVIGHGQQAAAPKRPGLGRVKGPGGFIEQGVGAPASAGPRAPGGSAPPPAALSSQGVISSRPGSQVWNRGGSASWRDCSRRRLRSPGSRTGSACSRSGASSGRPQFFQILSRRAA